MATKQLKIGVRVDSGGLNRDLNKSKKYVNRFGREVEQSGNKGRRALERLNRTAAKFRLPALAGPALFSGLIYGVGRSISKLDDLAKAAQRAGTVSGNAASVSGRSAQDAGQSPPTAVDVGHAAASPGAIGEAAVRGTGELLKPIIEEFGMSSSASLTDRCVRSTDDVLD